MPCRDYYDDHPEAYFRDVTEPALKKQISFAESALCAALSALERANNGSVNPAPSALDWMDFAAAGITQKELVQWRKTHMELDKKHRAEEARKLKERALAKLTPEERQALGIK